MPRRVVHLHVGTHKTGTTSLQAYLADQSGFLAAQGIDFLQALRRGPQRARLVPNNAPLAHHLLRTDLVTPLRWRSRDDPGFASECLIAANRTREALRDSIHDRFVVSSESFCFMRTDAERQALLQIFEGCELRPVVVFRREPEWRDSFTAQLLKSGYASCAAEIADPARRVDQDWYYARDTIAAFWRSVGPTVLISYEEATALDGSTIPAVLRAIGLDAFPSADTYYRNQRR